MKNEIKKNKEFNLKKMKDRIREWEREREYEKWGSWWNPKSSSYR